MITAGIDIETTGLEIGDHRIIEIYIGLYADNGQKLKELNQRIDPERSIAVDAQRVHGISIQDLAGKPNWDTVGPIVYKWLSVKGLAGIVWHNGDDFDGPFIAYELTRIGLKMPELPTLDTMKNGVWATPDGKKPNLEELCFACGVPYDKSQSHKADYDVDVMMQAYFKAKSWGFYQPLFASTPQPTSVAA